MDLRSSMRNRAIRSLHLPSVAQSLTDEATKALYGPPGIAVKSVGRCASPIHRDTERALLSIAAEQVAARAAEVIQAPRHVHVPSAVALDEVQPSLLEPLQTLQAIGGLPLPQGRLGQILEP